MIASLLLQTDPLSPVQRAVRSQFQEGGSLASALLILMVVVLGVCGAYWFTRRQVRLQQSDPLNDPDQLFRDLQDRLALPAPQRTLLDSVIKESRLEHPSALLLSPELFDRYVARWQEDLRQGGNVSDDGDRLMDEENVDATRGALFPGDMQ